MSRTLKSLLTLVVMGVPVWVVVLAVARSGQERGSVYVEVDEPGAVVEVAEQRIVAADRLVGPIAVEPGTRRMRVLVGGFPVYDRLVKVEPGRPAKVRVHWVLSEDDLSSNDAIPAQPVTSLEAAAQSLESEAGVSAVSTADGGAALVAVGDDGRLAEWDAVTGRLVRQIQAHGGKVAGLSVLADGHHAITSGDDLTLRLWDLDSGKLLRTIGLGTTELPICLSAAPDGRTVAIGGFSGLIQVFDLQAGRERYRRYIGPHAPGALAFSPDGRTLLLSQLGTPGKDHPVLVWDVATGTPRRPLVGHRSPVGAVAFLPDGRRAVTGSTDRTVRVWDVASARELKRYENHPGVVSSVAVSRDGRFVLAGTGHQWGDGWSLADAYGAQLWDLETDRFLGRFTTPAPVRSVAFSPDGRLALAADSAHTLRSWHLPTLPAATFSPILSNNEPTSPRTPAS